MLEGYGIITSLKEKNQTVVIHDYDRSKKITFQIPDYITCYDKYERECTLKDIKYGTLSYKFIKEGELYTIVSAKNTKK